MARNGRKLTTSLSERYLGSLGYNQGHKTTTGGASELVEADVWPAADDADSGGDQSGSVEWALRASAESNGSFCVYRNHDAGGLSLAFDDSGDASSRRIVHQCRQQDSVAESPRGRRLGTSAPVNVPDWSKIYRVDSVESMHDSDDGLDESELIPPHEYLARSRRMAANSVYEGVGRTLKGRDLSRVRDAVWSQTGFDG